MPRKFFTLKEFCAGTTGSNIKQINVESFAKGMYILSVQTAYGSIHKRVVIQ